MKEGTILTLSWTDILNLCKTVATEIGKMEVEKIDLIYIPRGGRWGGVLVKEMLLQRGCRCELTEIEDWQGGDGLRVVIDDIADTGKTMVRAREYAKELEGKRIIKTALCTRSKSFVDVYGLLIEETVKWVRFPWEGEGDEVGVRQGTVDKIIEGEECL